MGDNNATFKAWGNAVGDLADRVNLPQRLLRFGITPLTRDNLRLVRPILQFHLNGITSRFYDFVQRFPEGKTILAKHDTVKLRHRQQSHWEMVFDCRFDHDYLTNALGIGHAHYRAKVPPPLYMAGYNFFLGDLLRLVATEYKGSDMAAAAASITRVVNLDMSLALTAFMVDSLLRGETI
ncbi:protoglobin domain-containing protein [Ferrovibrio sp.]|uniref:protoglobin domain-containing protein n=1 Tax=Ferrovibrio sp. TaxID=1917215 RepID=UPI003D2B1525